MTNKINYDKEMSKIISEVKKNGERPKLLLHACCAPCASASILRVIDYFDTTVYFYNPNMDTAEEYYKREKELIKLCDNFSVKCICEPFLSKEFYDTVKGLEDLLEGGKRCEKCFSLRLEKTAEYAKQNGFDYFTTTLTLSPLKNAELINNIGNEIAEKVGIKFLPSDFKKQGGYLKSIELSKYYGLYRQNYCGCVFSKRNLPN